MRKTGETILVKVWAILCDLVELIVGIYKNAFSKRTIKTTKQLQKYAVCNALSGLMTSGAIALLMHGSFIWTGTLYAFASVEKRIAIAWASEKGDWSHILTGGRYEVFRLFKENLIANDRFAQFLNSLGGNGVAAKVLQIVLLLICVVSFAYLVFVVLRCIDRVAWSLKVYYLNKKEDVQQKRKFARESHMH